MTGYDPAEHYERHVREQEEGEEAAAIGRLQVLLDSPDVSLRELLNRAALAIESLRRGPEATFDSCICAGCPRHGTSDDGEHVVVDSEPLSPEDEENLPADHDNPLEGMAPGETRTVTGTIDGTTGRWLDGPHRVLDVEGSEQTLQERYEVRVQECERLVAQVDDADSALNVMRTALLGEGSTADTDEMIEALRRNKENVDTTYAWRVEVGKALGKNVPEGWVPGVDQLVHEAETLAGASRHGAQAVRTLVEITELLDQARVSEEGDVVVRLRRALNIDTTATTRTGAYVPKVGDRVRARYGEKALSPPGLTGEWVTALVCSEDPPTLRVEDGSATGWKWRTEAFDRIEPTTKES